MRLIKIVSQPWQLTLADSLDESDSKILKIKRNLVLNISCVILTKLPLKKRVEKIWVKMAYHLVACAQQLHQTNPKKCDFVIVFLGNDSFFLEKLRKMCCDSFTWVINSDGAIPFSSFAFSQDISSSFDFSKILLDEDCLMNKQDYSVRNISPHCIVHDCMENTFDNINSVWHTLLFNWSLLFLKPDSRKKVLFSHSIYLLEEFY